MSWKRKPKRKTKDAVEERKRAGGPDPFTLKVLAAEDVLGTAEEAGDGTSSTTSSSASLSLGGLLQMDPDASPFAFVRADCTVCARALAAPIAAGEGYVYARSHAQFILRCAASEAVPDGCIVLTQVQRQTMKVTKGDAFEWNRFDPQATKTGTLSDVSIEVRRRLGSVGSDDTQHSGGRGGAGPGRRSGAGCCGIEVWGGVQPLGGGMVQ